MVQENPVGQNQKKKPYRGKGAITNDGEKKKAKRCRKREGRSLVTSEARGRAERKVCQKSMRRWSEKRKFKDGGG